MAGYLICVSYESGIPIFARRIGEIPPIPFPLAASLNGVSLFGKVNKVELMSTCTETGRICWKDYIERISLIFVGPDNCLTDVHHRNLLDNVFNAMVFHIGMDDVMNINNLEKLKKECRSVYPVIDKYLYGVSPMDNTFYFGDITFCADVCLHSETQAQFQGLLDSLLPNTGCGHGAIIVNGVITAASKDWWCLKGEEMCLITFVASQPSVENFIDVPIFLPVSSPKLPYRLIVSRAKRANIQLVILCGQEPESSVIQREIKKWKNSTKELFSLFMRDDRSPSLYSRLSNLDPTVLGFLIINNDKQRCSYVMQEGGNSNSDSTSIGHRLDTLRTFYRTTIGPIFPFTGLHTPEPASSEGYVAHTAGNLLVIRVSQMSCCSNIVLPTVRSLQCQSLIHSDEVYESEVAPGTDKGQDVKSVAKFNLHDVMLHSFRAFIPDSNFQVKPNNSCF